jgi:hypothetical protein
MTRKETSYGRRLVTAAGFAAALTLGVIGHPAIADAKSKGMNWDTYQDCMNKSTANNQNVSVEVCCIQAGGVVVADRTTRMAECWGHVPTPEECQRVIGPNCTRQVPPGMDPAVPTIDNPPVNPGLRTKPPIDPTPIQVDDPSVTSSNPS